MHQLSTHQKQEIIWKNTYTYTRLSHDDSAFEIKKELVDLPRFSEIFHME